MDEKNDSLRRHSDGDGAPRPEEITLDKTQNASRVEAFSPSEYFYGEPPRGANRKKRKRSLAKRRKIVWTAILGVLLVLFILAGVYVYRLTYRPSDFFGGEPTKSPTASPAPAADGLTPAPTEGPTPTPSELDLLTAQAEGSEMSNILNVAVIGVDYAEERETWSGKHDYHADVIMIIAINFDERRVDLISIPRDTYANIPNVKGIYKINGSINCGGGFTAEGGAGFLKTCETASWMLGGIPVDYYYAVTMPAVKQLVDAFGGVDYNLEMSFTMAGRKYYKGQQHMTGQGVLDYLRVRKNLTKDAGDLNRINRQKDMMVALFKQMKGNNLIVKIPEIISAFDGQLFTNCTMSQTAALARFAYDLDSENIGMYSMDGTMSNIFGWNFVLTDQEKRVEIIKNVYGVDVPIEKEYTSTYARYRWQSMLAEKYLSTTKRFREQAAAEIKAGALEYEEAYDSYIAFTEAYTDLEQTLEYANEQAEKYRNGEKNSLSSAAGALSNDNNNLKAYAIGTAGFFDTGASFNWGVYYWKDRDFNEVSVDFR